MTEGFDSANVQKVPPVFPALQPIEMLQISGWKDLKDHLSPSSYLQLGKLGKEKQGGT